MKRVNILVNAVFWITFLNVSVFSFGQNLQVAVNSHNTPKRHRCGTQFILEKEYKKNPSLRQLSVAETPPKKEKLEKASPQIQARINNTLTVPVVVHVILSNPELVTDAQILSQITVLNTDFGGLNGDSTRIPTAFKSLFGKGRIQFCLAKRSPTGEATNGIIRVKSNIKSNPGLGDPVKYTSKGGSDSWNPRQYLNIWVCDDSTAEFLGYTYTPVIPLSSIPLQERGFVNQYQCFGKGGTAAAPYNLGRTAVHEIGHFFNLQHIWGPTNCEGGDDCSDDDGIGDTPRQEGCNYGAPSASQVITDNCTTSSPGIMWMNFMDYVDDRAMVMYTQQQHAKMEATFTTFDWMLELANSEGCIPPQALERDVRLVKLNNNLTSFNSTYQYTCSNSFVPEITVRNVGTTNVNSLRIETIINNGTPVITNWNGSVVPAGETAITLNSINVNAGINSNLVINITEVNGQNDLNSLNNNFTGSGIVFPRIVNLPFTEGFEQTNFPSVNWRLLNPDNDFSWERTTTAKKVGAASMFINNFDTQENGLQDWMISPLIPARGRDSLFMSFQVAAATFRTPSQITDATDTLEVLVSSDCASGFINRYTKAGLNLVTTGNVPVEQSFTPTTTQWRKDSVFLGFYDASGPEFIQAAFKHTTHWENNIYVDDVRIYNRLRTNQTDIEDITANKNASVNVYPNPFINQIIVDKINDFNKVPYRLVNIFGQEIRRGILNEQKTIIDLSGISSGVYFFHVKSEVVKLVRN